MNAETMASSAVLGDDAFSDDVHGLPCVTLSCGGSRVTIARQGAQVISWRDANGRERMYLSSMTGGARRGESVSDTLPASIRGGTPICFPQFSVRGPLLKHGFARVLPWTLASLTETGERSRAILTLRDDNASRAIWPHAFLLQLEVELAAERLVMTLSVTNTGDVPWSFTGALHSYLHVDEIAKTELTGLQNVRYQDATADNAEVVEQSRAITVNAELDRVYLAPPSTLQLVEGGKPSLFITHTGFSDTVVWNPGPVLARTLKDMPDDDWHRMLCVEAACASAPVNVQPGETWIGSQALTPA